MMLRKYRIAVAGVLVGLMGIPPSRLSAQQPARPLAAAVPLDLGYVTPQTMAVIVAHPRRVFTAPQMEMLPVEALTAAGIKELGLDPVDIKEAYRNPSGHWPDWATRIQAASWRVWPTGQCDSSRRRST